MDRHKLKAVRLDKNLTQAQFGALLGVSESTIANIETGRRGISDNVFSRLAKAKIDLGKEFTSFFMLYKEISKTTPNKS